jgi:O-antigen/teichoic acid export membrane protein
MKKLFSNQVINIFLRGTTVLLKFILSVLVIKKLSIEEFGVFGLFQSTIIISTFILGFDFYNFTSREILKENAKSVSYYFINQLAFHLVVYILIVPLTFFVFISGIIHANYLWLFVLILISEHLSQELYRLLIILNKSVAATTLLFLRSGLWVLFLYFFWTQNILTVNINSILFLWLLGAISSVLLGFKFANLNTINKINFKWIIYGVKVSLPFFIGTILYKIIEFSGRYFLSFYHSETEVGVYTFFTSISNILFVFVQTIVIIELYPKLIKAKNNGQEEFFLMLRIFKKQIIQYSIIGIVLSIICIYPLLWFLDKTALFESVFAYLLLLVSTLFFCFSFISHYALYVNKKDFDILKATIISFIFNISLSFVLIPRFAVLGAALAQLSTFAIMFIIKSIYWEKQKLES